MIETDGRNSLISVFSLILGQKVARDLVEFRNKSDIQGQVKDQSSDTLNSLIEDSEEFYFSFHGLITK